MKLESPIKDRLGIALNESRLLGMEFDPDQRVVNSTFSVLSLDEDGNTPADNRVIILFGDVGRIAASLRNGDWNDYHEKAIPFDISSINEIVSDFQGQSVYGWDFVNNPNSNFNRWEDNLSCSFLANDKVGFTNTIDLFQDYFGERFINIRIWFDKIAVINPDLSNLGFERFIENGERAWKAISDGSPSASNFPVIRAEGNEALISKAVSEMSDNTNIKLQRAATEPTKGNTIWRILSLFTKSDPTR